MAQQPLPTFHDHSIRLIPDRVPTISHLTAIARMLRRNTVHLPTIRQNVVNAIGQAYGFNRCLFLNQAPPSKALEVTAEFCQPGIPHFTDVILPDESAPWKQLLTHNQPLRQQQVHLSGEALTDFWIVPTLYQNQVNGYLCLQQLTPFTKTWHPENISLLTELAEQVGTVIANATLYQELNAATKMAEEASQLKSEFLASTTHELRTPLNGIIGFLRLILDGMADSEAEKQEFLEEAYQSALLLLNLINDILDLAKIEAGNIELDLKTVDFDEVLKSVENFAQPQAQRKDLKFQIHRPSDVDSILILGHERWLLQVMLNIVGNALKFTPAGRIDVQIDVISHPVTWQDKTQPGFVKVSVTDTGIGVALDQQPKLFKKFVQVDGSHSRAYGGTGLGLVISQKLLKSMGGKVQFFSMGQDLGATVTFTLLLAAMPSTPSSSAV